MTNDDDALNAFLGVLQRLETYIYKEGLPLADFQWALLWNSQSPPKRRIGFPTWSWAGWRVGIWPTYPLDLTKPHQYPIHLFIWKALEGQLVLIFGAPQGNYKDAEELWIIFKNDPITRAAQCVPQEPQFEIGRYPSACGEVHLFMEVILLHFALDFSRPIYGVRKSGLYEIFRFDVGDIRCVIKIISTDLEIDRPARSRQQFILLARDRHNGLIYHHLLLVHMQGNVAVRGTVLVLIVPQGHLGVLDKLEPKKRRIVLA